MSLNTLPFFELHDEEYLHQKAIKEIRKIPEDLIPLMEIINTVEGEGSYIGTPRVLARVSGCAIRCSWCDTKHTWLPKGDKNHGSELVTIEEFVSRVEDVAQGTVREVSITGGEPMHYPAQLLRIIHMLTHKGYLVSIETSGMIIDYKVFKAAYSVSMDIKTPSSGITLTKENIARLIECAFMVDEVQLKAVITNHKDLEFIKENFGILLEPMSTKRVKPLILTPCADNTKRDVPSDELLKTTEMIKDWNKAYHIRIISQQHKLLHFL
jgi:7-carboxy-7-deazaguanine synthase